MARILGPRALITYVFLTRNTTYDLTPTSSVVPIQQGWAYCGYEGRRGPTPWPLVVDQRIELLPAWMLVWTLSWGSNFQVDSVQLMYFHAITLQGSLSICDESWEISRTATGPMVPDWLVPGTSNLIVHRRGQPLVTLFRTLIIFARRSRKQGLKPQYNPRFRSIPPTNTNNVRLLWYLWIFLLLLYVASIYIHPCLLTL